MLCLFLLLLPQVLASPPPPFNEVVPRPEESLDLILDFTDGLPIKFFDQNDGVMGGVSTGTIAYDEKEEAGVFYGTTLTENNGGFSSVMSKRSKSLEGPGKEGMRLVVKGDGRFYRVDIQTTQPIPTFYHDFKTEEGEYITVEVYFKDFIPQYHGMKLKPILLDAGEIVNIGFMHTKFTMFGLETFPDWEEGDFELFIKTVEYF
eukprot:TRINITY_DN754_c0_g1_i1.p1 TRINITY_DN754_c0_g1~~TRINITY_DN754_c0_g1_i1.p1  ORF type:complete len:204 (-),score=24.02 TRINITY_DN754_c0_g1_i1:166-777(-)